MSLVTDYLFSATPSQWLRIETVKPPAEGVPGIASGRGPLHAGMALGAVAGIPLPFTASSWSAAAAPAHLRLAKVVARDCPDVDQPAGGMPCRPGPSMPITIATPIRGNQPAALNEKRLRILHPRA